MIQLLIKGLAALKGISVLGKLGGVLGLFSFIPGGQILGVVGSAFSAAASFVGWALKWVFADIADGFKEPQRLVVRGLCMLVVLGLGAYGGIKHQEGKDAAKVAQLTRLLSKATDENNAWRQRYAEQEKRAGEAETARKAAEDKLARNGLGGVAVGTPAAEPAKRVRPKATPAAAKASGPGLFSFPTYRR